MLLHPLVKGQSDASPPPSDDDRGGNSPIECVMNTRAGGEVHDRNRKRRVLIVKVTLPAPLSQGIAGRFGQQHEILSTG